MDTVICYNRVYATVVELVDTRDSKSATYTLQGNVLNIFYFFNVQTPCRHLR